MSRLDAYRRKRDDARTPEPFGGGLTTGGRLFVVQKHHATSLHYDLRLEHDGALLSWAVPKGPSPDPADKRLAMKVEDHPLEYAEFEGVIPEGSYGAGPSIAWDRGTWTPAGDVDEGLARGKLLFDLAGYKLRGRWTLVKTRQSENSWLLIKERDGHVDDRGTEAYPDDSIYSGLTVDELERADERAREIASALAGAGAPGGDVGPFAVEVMLAVSREEPFSKPGWVFELKLDGYRIVAGRDRGEAVLVSRNHHDLTRTFPEVARAVAGLPYDGLVLDGEVVVHDARGLPSFDRLQRRGRLRRWADVQRASIELPATYYAFDLLACEGRDARGLPLLERKRVLEEILPSVGPIRFSDHVAEHGEAVWERAVALGIEGIVGKRADSPYRAGRSRDWAKVRAVRTDDFVVVGWTEPKGSRSGFGALHLARYDIDDRLVYAGSVGTGFDEATLGEVRARLDDLAADAPPCEPPGDGELPRTKRDRWVRPRLVVEVRYREVTAQGILRHPVFERLRPDKPPEACRAEGVHPDVDEPPVPAPSGPIPHDVALTNLDKTFWPDEGYTKGDLVDYYRAVADAILPYLRDRPLVLTRYPDGIEGKSFFQKDAPEWAPPWLRTATIASDGAEREIDHFVVEDLDSLLWVANSAAILLHVWASRVASLGRPDWCVLDLDPKEAPFGNVVEIARMIRALCDEIGLPAFVKTSGGSGLHVLVPLGRRVGWDEQRTLGELLARIVARERDDIATVERVIRRREGKVYVDYLQNGEGKLLVAPFSARPLPGAPVSTPLRWREVVPSLDPKRFTIETVPRRVRAMKDDPLLPVLEGEPDLGRALDRLGRRIG